MKKQKNNFGFTLIELVVSVGIIALLSFSVFSLSNVNSQKRILNGEADKVISLFEMAESYAIAGQISALDETMPHGYGVFLNPVDADKLFFFNDLNDNNNYDEGEDIVHYNLNLTEPVVLGLNNQTSIFFTKYLAETKINGVETSEKIEINLINKSNPKISSRLLFDPISGMVE